MPKVPDIRSLVEYRSDTNALGIVGQDDLVGVAVVEHDAGTGIGQQKKNEVYSPALGWFPAGM